MAIEESNIAAGYRCDSHRPQEAKIPVFVPPRPRDRRRQGKGDSRAGYWCRRATYLAKKVTVASHEAREAKRLVQVVQVAREAHERQLQQLQEQVQALQELFAGAAAAKGDGLMATHTHTHTPHPHTPEGARSGSSRGSAEGSSPSTDLECGGSPGGVRAGPHVVDCTLDGSSVTQELLLAEARKEACRARGRSMAVQFMLVLLLYQKLHICIDEWRVNRRPGHFRWGPRGMWERRLVHDRQGTLHSSARWYHTVDCWSVRKTRWCSREWRARVARDHAASAQ